MPSPMTGQRGFTHGQAPGYLGVKRKFFEKHIRPRTNPVRCGTTLIFDRFDLDRAFDEYKAERNGRPGEKGGNNEWADQQSRASTGTKKAAGTSTRSTVVTDFAKASERIMAKRRAGSSRSSPG